MSWAKTTCPFCNRDGCFAFDTASGGYVCHRASCGQRGRAEGALLARLRAAAGSSRQQRPDRPAPTPPGISPAAYMRVAQSWDSPEDQYRYAALSRLVTRKGIDLDSPYTKGWTLDLGKFGSVFSLNIPVYQRGVELGCLTRPLWPVDDDTLKYKSMPGTSTSSCLYGLDEHVRSMAVIVEAPLDVFLLPVGVPLALFGTSVSNAQQNMIRGVVRGYCVILFDPDAWNKAWEVHHRLSRVLCGIAEVCVADPRKSFSEYNGDLLEVACYADHGSYRAGDSCGTLNSLIGGHCVCTA